MEKFAAQVDSKNRAELKFTKLSSFLPSFNSQLKPNQDYITTLPLVNLTLDTKVSAAPPLFSVRFPLKNQGVNHSNPNTIKATSHKILQALF